MSNNIIISFFVYIDGIAKHTYEQNNSIQYDVIALYPESLFDEVVKIVDKYKYLSRTNVNFSITVANPLSIKRSSFIREYGLSADE